MRGLTVRALGPLLRGDRACRVPCCACPSPGGQMRRIKPFPAQQSTALTGMLTGLCFSEDPQLVVCRKFPSRGFLRHLRIRDRMKSAASPRRRVDGWNSSRPTGSFHSLRPTFWYHVLVLHLYLSFPPSTINYAGEVSHSLWHRGLHLFRGFVIVHTFLRLFQIRLPACMESS